MRAFLLVFVVAVWSVSAYKLPSQFDICKRFDPKRDECLVSAIQKGIRSMENGLPEINFPNSQPIVLESLTVAEGKGPVRVEQKYTNFQLFDVFPKIVVDSANSTVTDTEFKLYLNLSISKAYFTADYDFDGQVLLLPIVGKGPCRVTLNDNKIEAKIIGKPFVKKEVEYLDITDFEFRVFTKKAEYQFDNLFNGNEKLGSEMNTLLNDNWKVIYDDVIYGYEFGLSAAFKQLSNIVFHRVAYKDLFPL